MSDLHLDFSELTFLDSAALSGLLMLHRRTSQAGVALHLKIPVKPLVPLQIFQTHVSAWDVCQKKLA